MTSENFDLNRTGEMNEACGKLFELAATWQETLLFGVRAVFKIFVQPRLKMVSVVQKLLILLISCFPMTQRERPIACLQKRLALDFHETSCLGLIRLHSIIFGIIDLF